MRSSVQNQSKQCFREFLNALTPSINDRCSGWRKSLLCAFGGVWSMVHLDPQINRSWPQPQCVDCTNYQAFRGGGVESAGEVFIEFQEGATP